MNDQLVARAAALLKAESGGESFVNIGWLDVFIRDTEAMRRVTKDDRRNLKSYLKVLERLRAAQSKIKHLDGVLIESNVYPGEIEVIEKVPFQSLLPIDDEIKIVKVMLGRSGGGTDKRAQIAVKFAHLLLDTYKIPAVVARKSVWCRLAAILYGEPSKDLYHYVAEFRARPKPVSE